MCGIAGVLNKNSGHAHEIESMIAQLRHRGPDAQLAWSSDDAKVALGHTRLSVIDLSETANQPMVSQDGRYIIVFNGEIYNFKSIRREIETRHPGVEFKTTSDTEVILHAYALWGEQMMSRLGGMFALAIWDTETKTMFLCRDRVGKKPLFYYHDDNHFIFASEIKSLLKHPVVNAAKRQLDTGAVHQFLHLGYIPEPRTIFSSIKKFPAGFAGTVNAGLAMDIKAYWTVEAQLHPKPAADDATVKQNLTNILTEAVQQRLISDVPLGAFLSGGTDSSLVTALASKNSTGALKTFSIGFAESKYDESDYARRVASHLGTDHHAYTLSEQEAVGILETYLKHFDEPFADTSAIPTMLVSKLARKEVTVALTGDGGDELFQGYGAYNWAGRLNNPLIRLFQTPLAFGLRNFGDSRLKRIAHMLEKVDETRIRSHIFSQEQYFFSDRELKENLLRRPASYTSFTYHDPQVANVKLTAREQQAIFDLKFYLKDDLLVKVDRASMFHALECRCPLLDHTVVEFALNLPLSFKLRGNVHKWILKEVLGDYLPAELVYRPKWGFSIPLVKWLKNELRYLIDDYLNKTTIETAGLVHYEYVNALKEAFLNGNDYLYNRLWTLIVIHKWLRENE
ncbi:asparagine synthase (glutamine-hydrolysing) [Chryseolinea serpens]|uniref:asparagine synthase (glutamine-hydrolyzing) n=1 Tax=Chryseolinea serpens TaxID=947013 RepID=A0A1M5NCM3_9BACT|nr:asparagine synthase (glutamine-hydrolyzing) [Chryseolinea serpens]SHG87212.1 asparagine synthase (glutamine-hydrolysing) [Chryseolinea serpens]